ncbi:MAG: GTPase [Candidatus Methanomethylicota archaeon]|uniref:GTPase n=1 Tax=Thermoproteota archaeon TaxID=2056631 RepID=A0A497EWY0_9CREN|nr:MAG: GTPase [Candidatus Verstraetearchaeota archaeon]RLE55978.1 MAG: GTPase [Candidatus Verstraetearchaeota archaeon]
MLSIMVIGTAGSGKSALTAAFSDWLKNQEKEVGTLNLDPGVKWLPYSPDVDIREYISIDEVMEKYGLGPNGALIACVDMMANYIQEVRNEIRDLAIDYLIIDTPGQMELFAFRTSGPFITAKIGGENLIILCLLDSMFTKNPSDFVSILLLATSVQYRFLKPQINVISKADMLSIEDKMRIENWIENPDELRMAVMDERHVMQRELSKRISEAISSELLADLVFTSASTWEGFDNLYALIQRIAGEV